MYQDIIDLTGDDDIIPTFSNSSNHNLNISSSASDIINLTQSSTSSHGVFVINLSNLSSQSNSDTSTKSQHEKCAHKKLNLFAKHEQSSTSMKSSHKSNISPVKSPAITDFFPRVDNDHHIVTSTSSKSASVMKKSVSGSSSLKKQAVDEAYDDNDMMPSASLVDDLNDSSESVDHSSDFACSEDNHSLVDQALSNRPQRKRSHTSYTMASGLGLIAATSDIYGLKELTFGKILPELERRGWAIIELNKKSLNLPAKYKAYKSICHQAVFSPEGVDLFNQGKHDDIVYGMNIFSYKSEVIPYLQQHEPDVYDEICSTLNRSNNDRKIKKSRASTGSMSVASADTITVPASSTSSKQVHADSLKAQVSSSTSTTLTQDTVSDATMTQAQSSSASPKVKPVDSTKLQTSFLSSTSSPYLHPVENILSDTSATAVIKAVKETVRPNSIDNDPYGLKKPKFDQFWPCLKELGWKKEHLLPKSPYYKQYHDMEQDIYISPEGVEYNDERKYYALVKDIHIFSSPSDVMKYVETNDPDTFMDIQKEIDNVRNELAQAKKKSKRKLSGDVGSKKVTKKASLPSSDIPEADNAPMDATSSAASATAVITSSTATISTSKPRSLKPINSVPITQPEDVCTSTSTCTTNPASTISSLSAFLSKLSSSSSSSTNEVPTSCSTTTSSTVSPADDMISSAKLKTASKPRRSEANSTKQPSSSLSSSSVATAALLAVGMIMSSPAKTTSTTCQSDATSINHPSAVSSSSSAVAAAAVSSSSSATTATARIKSSKRVSHRPIIRMQPLSLGCHIFYKRDKLSSSSMRPSTSSSTSSSSSSSSSPPLWREGEVIKLPATSTSTTARVAFYDAEEECELSESTIRYNWWHADRFMLEVEKGCFHDAYTRLPGIISTHHNDDDEDGDDDDNIDDDNGNDDKDMISDGVMIVEVPIQSNDDNMMISESTSYEVDNQDHMDIDDDKDNVDSLGDDQYHDMMTSQSEIGDIRDITPSHDDDPVDDDHMDDVIKPVTTIEDAVDDDEDDDDVYDDVPVAEADIDDEVKLWLPPSHHQSYAKLSSSSSSYDTQSMIQTRLDIHNIINKHGLRTSDIWHLLTSIGWQHVSASFCDYPKYDTCYVAPWTSYIYDIKDDKLRQSRFRRLQEGRDYFFENDDVIRYIKTYYTYYHHDGISMTSYKRRSSYKIENTSPMSSSSSIIRSSSPSSSSSMIASKPETMEPTPLQLQTIRDDMISSWKLRGHIFYEADDHSMIFMHHRIRRFVTTKMIIKGSNHHHIISKLYYDGKVISYRPLSMDDDNIIPAEWGIIYDDITAFDHGCAIFDLIDVYHGINDHHHDNTTLSMMMWSKRRELYLHLQHYPSSSASSVKEYNALKEQYDEMKQSYEKKISSYEAKTNHIIKELKKNVEALANTA